MKTLYQPLPNVRPPFQPLWNAQDRVEKLEALLSRCVEFVSRAYVHGEDEESDKACDLWNDISDMGIEG